MDSELLGKTVRIKNLYDERGEPAKALVEAVTIEYPMLNVTYRCWVQFADIVIPCSLEQIEVVTDEPG